MYTVRLQWICNSVDEIVEGKENNLFDSLGIKLFLLARSYSYIVHEHSYNYYVRLLEGIGNLLHTLGTYK